MYGRSFATGSSTEMPLNCTPSPSNCFCSSTNSGISVLHGTHHVAQKLRTMTLPLKSASFTLLSSESFSVKFSFDGTTLVVQPSVAAGASGGVDFCGVAERPVD